MIWPRNVTDEFGQNVIQNVTDKQSSKQSSNQATNCPIYIRITRTITENLTPILKKWVQRSLIFLINCQTGYSLLSKYGPIFIFFKISYFFGIWTYGYEILHIWSHKHVYKSQQITRNSHQWYSAIYVNTYAKGWIPPPPDMAKMEYLNMVLWCKTSSQELCLHIIDGEVDDYELFRNFQGNMSIKFQEDIKWLEYLETMQS